jgi:hypothetical protein
MYEQFFHAQMAFTLSAVLVYAQFRSPVGRRERKCKAALPPRRARSRCNDDNWSPADVLHPAPPLVRRADEEDVSIDFSLKKKKVSASPPQSGCPTAHAAACCHGDCCKRCIKAICLLMSYWVHVAHVRRRRSPRPGKKRRRRRK